MWSHQSPQDIRHSRQRLIWSHKVPEHVSHREGAKEEPPGRQLLPNPDFSLSRSEGLPLTECRSHASSPDALSCSLLAWFCTMDTPSHLVVFPVWLHCMSCETSLSSSQETVGMESEDLFTPFIQCRVAQISRDCAKTEARPTQVPWPESEAQTPTSCASALSRHSGAD